MFGSLIFSPESFSALRRCASWKARFLFENALGPSNYVSVAAPRQCALINLRPDRSVSFVTQCAYLPCPNMALLYGAWKNFLGSFYYKDCAPPVFRLLAINISQKFQRWLRLFFKPRTGLGCVPRALVTRARRVARFFALRRTIGTSSPCLHSGTFSMPFPSQCIPLSNSRNAWTCNPCFRPMAMKFRMVP